MKDISASLEKFSELISSELSRIEKMKEASQLTNFKELDKIIVGIAPGDGIGPIIIKQARKVLNLLLEEEIKAGRVELREIEGLTIEYRAEKCSLFQMMYLLK